ncbi:uncharacterized protein LOC129941956 [Eupeodes corollae]|uniref:uncharacterized protein LOC129941956 n=1 Tax=Eupeodes corollae TaxID=290404 RepID=UPI00249305E2|nr:uncharacterized protein LOC129941956 [Eupeodes corollae]
MSSSRGALFREIHKNSWLKRLTTDGKKITIGPKKSDRSWVVFCVHDDTEALLEGYAEPRLAPSHNPEWVVSMQDTQHISHALIPNSHEFEFVVTLSNEVVRFHAMSWEVMQEWVETLRSKLREMKIISPRENLYTKLPEVRAPLLPTRDPTSPLPATPPVPAAIVPGVERVVPSISSSSSATSSTTTTTTAQTPAGVVATTSISNVAPSTSTSSTTSHLQDTPRNSISIAATCSTPSIVNTSSSSNVSVVVPSSTTSACLTSMSNTLTQNLLNMLSDPISNYSEQLNTGNYSGATSADDDEEEDFSDLSEEFVMCLARPKLIPHTKIAHAALSPRSSLNESSNRSSSTELHNAITDTLSVRLDISSPANKEKDRKSLSPGRQVVRAQTSRSLSISETTPEITTVNNNITEFDVEKDLDDHPPPQPQPPLEKASSESSSTNITIIQVSNPLPSSNKGPEIFKFPDPLNNHDEEYKSNVQIIPSNLSTIPVHAKSAIANQYSSPARANAVKKIIPAPSSHLENHKITTVRVTAASSTSNTYGSVCPSSSSCSSSSAQTPKLSKKIILTTNTSGVTNIAVNNDVQQKTAHYEKVFLTSTVPISTPKSGENLNVASVCSPKMSRVKNTASQSSVPQSSTSSPLHSAGLKKKSLTAELSRMSIATQTTGTSTATAGAVSSSNGAQLPSTSTASPVHVARNPKSSPAMHRKRLLQDGRENCPPSALANRPFLTRGLTEAVITARPSRKDMNRPSHLKGNQLSNNNGEAPSAIERTRSESLEQRRRSSSTSDAPSPRTPRTNNNEPRASTRMQQPPQPFRLAHENALNAQSSKRMTLREQQVLQLRREIMHPGGVRLQLRRKDCIASIAWVDAFGAVWVAGWKQKEHPVLYNALHIGDQLISIAGITISSASEANKVIRNTNTLFLEVLIRRVPFGRGYAIRRERDGQCLGLIRDGNTSTIVDVVPNSLAARHGLPPKTQSCDGTTLTFWVLTEINGRPLNLFFKENEIRDRLNCIGRDISILVQPSDLITKLKKQLKSLRSHKDYIVQ